MADHLDILLRNLRDLAIMGYVKYKKITGYVMYKNHVTYNKYLGGSGGSKAGGHSHDGRAPRLLLSFPQHHVLNRAMRCKGIPDLLRSVGCFLHSSPNVHAFVRTSLRLAS